MKAGLYILIFVLSYLLGSMPSAYIIVKWAKGLDIRKFGSGNVGSTNTGRAAGVGYAVMVFFIDTAKGFLPALIGFLIAGPLVGMAAGIFAFIGHLFPVFLSFKGGKGVATGIGIAFALVPWLAAITLASWGALTVVFGYVSLASCTATLLLCLMVIIAGKPWPYIVGFLLLFVIVCWKHRSNFRHIKQGTESRIFRRKNY